MPFDDVEHKWNTKPRVKIPSTIIPKKIKELTLIKKFFLVMVLLAVVSFTIGMAVSVIDAQNPGPAQFDVLNIICFLTCMASGAVMVIAGLIYILIND